MTLRLASSSTVSTAFQPGIDEAFEIDVDQKGRILIVDDSRSVRNLFLNTLKEDYDCTTAACYEEAVDLLQNFPFDLAIVDVIMPGLSGNELLRKIVTTYPETTVIMASGVDRPQRAINSLKQGAFDYLIKPCELQVLELAVERAFDHRSLQQSAERYKKTLEARNLELEIGRAHLEQLQSKLVQNEKMVGLGQLAAGVAHELNNPVAFVHGNLDILHQTTKALVDILKFYESAGLPPYIVEQAAAMKAVVPYLSTIDDLESVISDCKDGADRIKDIVQNLRTFSRLDEADFKKIDVNQGLEATIRLLSQHFVGGSIELVKDLREIPVIDAFGSQLNQVWMNLLVNAAQSLGGKPGVVRVSTTREEEFVTVTVSDTGRGIARQDLHRIFEPFYTTKPIGEGTGLGLSICFGIVEHHSGTISAKSELGSGTAFTVRLPITQTEPVCAQRGIVPFEYKNKHFHKDSNEIQNTHS
jgi:two-component system, NtrC family, sensor kinase